MSTAGRWYEQSVERFFTKFLTLLISGGLSGKGDGMYLHLGQNEIVPEQRVIGIFDLDKCSYEKRTRDYLAAAEKEGVVLDVSGQLPRSFVVCDHPYHRQIVYLSQLSPATLQKRAESRQLEL